MLLAGFWLVSGPVAGHGRGWVSVAPRGPGPFPPVAVGPSPGGALSAVTPREAGRSERLRQCRGGRFDLGLETTPSLAGCSPRHAQGRAAGASRCSRGFVQGTRGLRHRRWHAALAMPQLSPGEGRSREAQAGTPAPSWAVLASQL